MKEKIPEQEEKMLEYGVVTCNQEHFHNMCSNLV